MNLRTLLLSFAVPGVLAAGAMSAFAGPPVPKSFDDPGRTTWRPEGCRSIPASSSIIGKHNRWRMLHSDIAASDEVETALAPEFEPDWETETGTFHVTVPVFDSAGNLYTVPYLPHENVTLISLDPTDGHRRWAIPGTGAPAGACAPITLEDPGHPGSDIIYVTLKDRAFAVRPDGSMVWDVPTGLTLTGVNTLDSTSGNSYLPQRDAIAGLTTGGELYLLDRTTGAQILPSPFSLPGEPSPKGAGVGLPQNLLDEVEADLGVFIKFPANSSFSEFLSAILGNGIEVSNSFAVDAGSGRLWVAATAPDAADGTVDGVSELGALYALDVVDVGGVPQVQIACRRDFVGGSASTPAVRSDGTRVYVGDNEGNVLAIDQGCNLVWSVAVGSQVTGSIAVASDNNEIYASTQTDIVKIIDNGATASIAWFGDHDVYNPNSTSRANFNSLLASISANGIGFMAGVGDPPGDLANIGFPLKVGYGVLDRDTGKVRYFADGLDESIAEMDSGPDGAYYNSNSPIRRAFTRVLVPNQPPLQGGIRKFAPRRVDLLVRDAVCAAADRAENAEANALACAAGAATADVEQIAELLGQIERMGPVAVTRGEMTASMWNRLAAGVAGAETATLANQATLLPRTCAIAAPCPATPLSGCLTAPDAKLSMTRRLDATPNADRFVWNWSMGQAFGDAQIGTPATSSDYGVCVYDNTDTTPRLIYETGMPASAQWHAGRNTAAWSGSSGRERGLSHFMLDGGADGGTRLGASGKGVTWPQATFPVSTPIVVQAVNVENGQCWTSTFQPSDAKQSDVTRFTARVRP